MQHPINIKVINNTNGVASPSDGVMGLFCKAVAVANTFNLDQGYLLTKLADLVPLGINAAYDVTNSTAVYQQVNEFYQGGLNDGAYLWLFGVAKATAFATYVASSTFSSLIRSTAIADPAMRVKMIGLCYDVPATTQSATDFPADVTATITALEAARVALFNLGYQFSALVDGYRMSTAVTPSSIGTMATKGAPGVSLVITGSLPNGVAGVGLALGRFARISIGQGFGAVEDGPIYLSTAYLTNSVIIPVGGTLIVGTVYTVLNGSVVYNGNTYTAGTEAAPTTFTCVIGFTTYTTPDTGYVVANPVPVATLGPTDINSLGSKQYMFLRTWFSHSGFYWNDGATCEDPTKQLSTQEYQRVANSLSADALFFFINQMGKNLPVDTKTGAIAQGYLNAKQAEFYNTYISQLTVNAGTGDLSDASILLSGPNFNSTKTMNFIINIVPTPILGAVNGTIMFSATL